MSATGAGMSDSPESTLDSHLTRLSELSLFAGDVRAEMSGVLDALGGVSPSPPQAEGPEKRDARPDTKMDHLSYLLETLSTHLTDLNSEVKRLKGLV